MPRTRIVAVLFTVHGRRRRGGYDAASIGPSTGLQNMADHIGALGGELHITSTSGDGTTVHGSVAAHRS